MPSIESMHQYPLSGAQGFPVDEAVITAAGMQGDRTWVVHSTESSRMLPGYPGYDVPAWRRIDGKADSTLPKLLTTVGRREEIYVYSSSGHELVLPPITQSEGATVLYVNEYGDPVPCHPAAEALTENLQAMLGNTAIALAHKTPAWLSGQLLAPEERAVAPLHIVNMASVRALQAAGVEHGFEFDARRFRAAISVKTDEPFAEYGPDGWIGKVMHVQTAGGVARIALHRPTQRCKVTGLDHLTGVQKNDVPELLRDLDNGKGLGVFGVYGHLLGGEAVTLAVGNEVAIIDRAA